jgi:hypothetical protein
MIGAAALLFMLTGAANLAAYDNAGLANIYATSLPTAESVTLLAINFDGSLILGMSEGHLRGITASGLRGINASGLRGINASGLRGITASGLRGINASGLRGITASGLRGITASGLRGITASGLRGITASGLRGITASGLRKVNKHSAIAVFEEIPLVAVGPLTYRTDGGNSINVLGQNVIFDEQTAVISFDSDKSFPVVAEGKDAFKLLAADDYIAVAGEIIGPGEHLGTVIIKLPERYSDGISLAYARSMAADVNYVIGLAKSGTTEIDFTGALYDSQFMPASNGSVVEYFGFTTSHTRLIAAYGKVISKK